MILHSQRLQQRCVVSRSIHSSKSRLLRSSAVQGIKGCSIVGEARVASCKQTGLHQVILEPGSTGRLQSCGGTTEYGVHSINIQAGLASSEKGKRALQLWEGSHLQQLGSLPQAINLARMHGGVFFNNRDSFDARLHGCPNTHCSANGGVIDTPGAHRAVEFGGLLQQSRQQQQQQPASHPDQPHGPLTRSQQQQLLVQPGQSGQQPELPDWAAAHWSSAPALVKHGCELLHLMNGPPAQTRRFKGLVPDDKLQGVVDSCSMFGRLSDGTGKSRKHQHDTGQSPFAGSDTVQAFTPATAGQQQLGHAGLGRPLKGMDVTLLDKLCLGPGAVYNSIQPGRNADITSFGISGAGLVVMTPVGDGTEEEHQAPASSASSSSSSNGYGAFLQQLCEFSRGEGPLPAELSRDLWMHGDGTIDHGHPSNVWLFGSGVANCSWITEVGSDLFDPDTFVDQLLANEEAMLQDRAYWQAISEVVLDLVNCLLQLSAAELSQFQQLPQPCQRPSALSFMGKLKHSMATRDIFNKVVIREHQYNPWVLPVVQDILHAKALLAGRELQDQLDKLSARKHAVQCEQHQANRQPGQADRLPPPPYQVHALQALLLSPNVDDFKQFLELVCGCQCPAAAPRCTRSVSSLEQLCGSVAANAAAAAGSGSASDSDSACDSDAESDWEDPEDSGLEGQQQAPSSRGGCDLQRHAPELLLLYQILEPIRAQLQRVLKDWLQYPHLQQFSLRTVLFEVVFRPLGQQLEAALSSSRQKHDLDGPHPLNIMLATLGRKWAAHVARRKKIQLRHEGTNSAEPRPAAVRAVISAGLTTEQSRQSNSEKHRGSCGGPEVDELLMPFMGAIITQGRANFTASFRVGNSLGGLAFAKQHADTQLRCGTGFPKAATAAAAALETAARFMRELAAFPAAAGAALGMQLQPQHCQKLLESAERYEQGAQRVLQRLVPDPSIRQREADSISEALVKQYGQPPAPGSSAVPPMVARLAGLTERLITDEERQHQSEKRRGSCGGPEVDELLMPFTGASIVESRGNFFAYYRAASTLGGLAFAKKYTKATVNGGTGFPKAATAAAAALETAARFMRELAAFPAAAGAALGMQLQPQHCQKLLESAERYEQGAQRMLQRLVPDPSIRQREADSISEALVKQYGQPPAPGSSAVPPMVARLAGLDKQQRRPRKQPRPKKQRVR